MQIENYVDADLLEKFEFRNYGHALEILHDAFPIEWSEVQECLRKLRLTVADIKKAGGNESPIPKKFDEVLYPFGWREIRISGDLIVKSILGSLFKDAENSRKIRMKPKKSKDILTVTTLTF